MGAIYTLYRWPALPGINDTLNLRPHCPRVVANNVDIINEHERLAEPNMGRAMGHRSRAISGPHLEEDSSQSYGAEQ